MPLPSAWKLATRMMHTAATGKHQLMVRRQVLPISRNASEGLNMPSSRSGANWNTRRPVTISVRPALQTVPDVCAVFENTAGQGSNLGYTFAQLADMLIFRTVRKNSLIFIFLSVSVYHFLYLVKLTV